MKQPLKKLLALALSLLLLFALAACGEDDVKHDSTGSANSIDDLISSTTSITEPVTDQSYTFAIDAEPDGEYDVDLTRLNATMTYAEVYNMCAVPDQYEGKKVKMEGLFSYWKDPDNGKEYFSCIIQDATACCAQGIEFVLKGNPKYPDDYPKQGETITVTGIFHSYKEDDNEYNLYLQLQDADMKTA